MLLGCRSLTLSTVESDATHQRKLRQKQLQQQFREQMEKQPQVQTLAPAPVEKQSEGERGGAEAWEVCSAGAREQGGLVVLCQLQSDWLQMRLSQLHVNG